MTELKKKTTTFFYSYKKMPGYMGVLEHELKFS